MSSKNKSSDLMKNCTLNSLPAEIKLELLKYLPVRDLRSIVRVSRAWRHVGEDPHLWSQTRVRITTRAASFLSDIISSSKMKLLRDLKLEQCVSAKTAESVLRLII